VEQTDAESVASASGAAAFFDLDRTLVQGSSGLHFARAAYKAGLISRGRLARDAWQNLRFRLRGTTDDRAGAVVARIGEMITDRSVRELRRLTPSVLAGVLPRVYPQMLELAWEHQDAGRRIYIFTAASQEIAEMLAHVLDFDGGVGTRSEIVNGAYTGRLDGPFTYRDGKAQAVRELAAAQGIDLDASYAYSDSESDLPMLTAVGHPVVVNPDTELVRIARERGWEILRLDPLRGRLRLGALLAAVAALGSAGGAIFNNRRIQAGGRVRGGLRLTTRRRWRSRRGAKRPALPRR
jgi:HAD superfamily hydrolase (TIGR01490 family)